MSVLGEPCVCMRDGHSYNYCSQGVWRPSAIPATPYPYHPLPSTYPYTTSYTYSNTADLYDHLRFSHLWPSYYLSYLQRDYDLIPGDPICNRSPPPYERRESPNKELPTKVLKHDRMKDRQELSQTLHYDKEHAAKINSKKCAGTQTQFTSFPADMYTNGDQPSAADTYPTSRPPYYMQANHSPIMRHSPNLPEPHEGPLNLSLQTSGQSRPSVITCATPVSTSRYSSATTAISSSSNSSNRAATSAECDSDIEEHFRRSLGKKYTELIVTTNSSSVPETNIHNVPPNNSPKPDLAVSITGSVDDHFARSLGNSTWSALKAKKDTAPGEVFTESVDDHFAKALGGDTWLRIKAEKEGSCDSERSSKNPSPSQIQQTASVLTT